MERLLELKQFCLDLAAANRDFHLDEDIWDKLPQVVKILGFFAKKMDFLQKENIMLSDVYGVWLELENVLEKEAVDCSLASALLRALLHRKTEYKMFSNDVTLVCMFLDLRYHGILSKQEQDRAEQHLLHLWEKISSKQKENQNEVDLLSQEQRGDPNDFDVDDSDDDLLEQIIKKKTECQQNDIAESVINDSLVEEIRKFKLLKREPAKSNIIERWTQLKLTFPTLHQLAMTVMAVAPTEVSCERNFSILDFVLTKRRNRLTDTNLEMILFLKLNSSMFESAFENGELSL